MSRDDSPRVQTATESAAEREALRRRALAREIEAQRNAPAVQAEPARRPAGSGRSRALAIGVAVAVAVAVAWTGSALLRSADSVSAADKASWAAAWAVAPPQVARAIPPSDVPAALDAMGLPPDQRAALQAELDSGRTRLVYLTFTDVVAEDGDRVRVQSDVYATEITIQHRTTKVVFPEPASGVVNVTGTFDGGGGITIAITSGEAPVNLPFMDVGQSVGIPVVVGR